jgi:hypothetical protein
MLALTLTAASLLGVGTLVSVAPNSSASAVTAATDSTTVPSATATSIPGSSTFDQTVTYSCDFAQNGPGVGETTVTVYAEITGTIAPSSIAPGGSVTVSSELAIANPPTFAVADALTSNPSPTALLRPYVTTVTISDVTTGIDASGDTAESEQTSSATSFNGSPLGTAFDAGTINSEPWTIELAPVTFAANDASGDVTLQAGDFELTGSSYWLPFETNYYDGLSCAPASPVTLGTADVAAPATTTTSTTTSTTSTTKPTEPVICGYVPFFLRWLFALILHCKY